MDGSQKQPELTPAAQSALDDMTEAYRQRLLYEAKDISKARAGAPELVSLEDVTRAYELDSAEIVRLRENTSFIRRLGKPLLALVLFSAVGVLANLLVNSVTFAEFGGRPFAGGQPGSSPLLIFDRPAAEVLTWTAIMLAALAVIGILAALIWQASRRDITKEVTLEDRQLALLSSWIDLEKAARTYTAQHYGESKATTPIRAVLSLDLFPPDERERLQQALLIRNETVHGGREFSQAEYEGAISTVRRATNRLAATT